MDSIPYESVSPTRCAKSNKSVNACPSAVSIGRLKCYYLACSRVLLRISFLHDRADTTPARTTQNPRIEGTDKSKLLPNSVHVLTPIPKTKTDNIAVKLSAIGLAPV